jgi:hypothetical protein
MSADDPQTQSRSTRGRLELPLKQDAWLGLPYNQKKHNRVKPRKGFISLEIRRLRNPPAETQQEGIDSLVNTVKMEMLDDDDEAAANPPFIIFRFEFQPAKTGNELISFNSPILQDLGSHTVPVG